MSTEYVYPNPDFSFNAFTLTYRYSDTDLSTRIPDWRSRSSTSVVSCDFVRPSRSASWLMSSTTTSTDLSPLRVSRWISLSSALTGCQTKSSSSATTVSEVLDTISNLQF